LRRCKCADEATERFKARKVEVKGVGAVSTYVADCFKAVPSSPSPSCNSERDARHSWAYVAVVVDTFVDTFQSVKQCVPTLETMPMLKTVFVGDMKQEKPPQTPSESKKTRCETLIECEAPIPSPMTCQYDSHWADMCRLLLATSGIDANYFYCGRPRESKRIVTA